LDVIVRPAAILFDKDGTLFGFNASWAAFTRDVITHYAGGNPGIVRSLAEALGFDMAALRFAPDSLVIAGTLAETACALHAALVDASGTAQTVPQIETYLHAQAINAPMVPVTDLPALMADLRARNLMLGLATNDAEAAAHAHLGSAGIADAFGFVAGYDSGHGAKPGPGQCRAFARVAGQDPARIAMVGDSLHDLQAGRAAGMICVAVETGVATAADLTPHADVVLRDIGALPAWLDGLPPATTRT
jgi:phosphoglycolate phosphatase